MTVHAKDHHFARMEVSNGLAIAGCSCGAWLEMRAELDTHFYGIAYIDGCRAIDLCQRRLHLMDPADSWGTNPQSL